MMKPKALICAGSYNQFMFWCRENGKSPNEYRYVATEKDCFGYAPHSIPVLYFGTYYMRDNVNFDLLQSINNSESSP